MIVPFWAALFYFVIFQKSDRAQLLYTLTKIFTLLWPPTAVYVIEKRRFLRPKKMFAGHLKSIPLGLLSGVVMAGLIWGFYRFSPLGITVREFAPQIIAKVAALGLLEHYVAFSVFLAVFHSLLEEYYWRWYVFGRLQLLTSWKWSYPLAGLAFAAHHFVVLSTYFPPFLTLISGVGVAIGGIFWCWLYHRYQSLLGCWLSHFLVDVIILYIGFLLIF